MSDTPTSPTPDSSPTDGPDQASAGPWQRYRALPLPLQILIPVAAVGIAAGVVLAVTSSDGDETASTASTVADDAGLEALLKGIIVVGGFTQLGPETTEAAATSTPGPATAPTTGEPEPTTATTTDDAPASTADSSTTAAPASTVETTESPPTTADPPSTPAPETTEAPATTVGASSPFPTTSAFLAQWNDATAGTEVPIIADSQAIELTGEYAGYYLITLSPEQNPDPSQVGLLGTLTSPGSGQLAELLLVWIPGEDDDSSEFYWDCFAVLIQAINPDATAEEIAALESELGRAPGWPPFTTTSEASSGGFDFSLFSQPYAGAQGPVEVSAIAVT